MNWWKKSNLENFDDRNRANRYIHWLEEAVEILVYASELVFQTSRKASEMIKKLHDHKIMSSFPSCQDILKTAIEKAVDNPYQFQNLCVEAADILTRSKIDLEKSRTLFVQQKGKKGWQI